jgi:hypothetical protein
MRSIRAISVWVAALLVATAAPVLASQRVFIASTLSMGDLGGLEGADETCQEHADSQALGGSWVAWLSDSGTDAIDRLRGSGPFVEVGSDAIIAADRDELTSGTLQNGISRTESGVQIPAAVWTGTDADGSADDDEDFCGNWTDSTNTVFGQTGAAQNTGPIWTDANTVFCNLELRLYCFEQGPSSAMAPALSPGALVSAVVLLALLGVWTITTRSRRSGNTEATADRS